MAPAGGMCRDCRRAQLSSTCCRGGLLRRGTRIRRRGDDADHISALPDDILLQILARLDCARAAAHTGLLSRRWRGLWTRLPELDFHRISPDRLRAALDQVARPAGSLRIFVPGHHSLSPACISSLLRAAALLAPAKLAIDVNARGRGDADVVDLPCFDRTTSLKLSFASRFTLPPVGDFKALESLSLGSCPIELDALFSRCSLLRKLEVYRWDLDAITVHSPSLEELDVCAAVQLRRVDIVAPLLKKLRFNAINSVNNEYSFSFSAPLLEDLSWHCQSRSATDRFGVIWSMSYLTLKTLESTGHPQLTDSRQCSLLQDSPRHNVLLLSLRIGQNINLADADQSFGQDISRIPVRNFTILELDIGTGGHVYGAMVLDLLGLCTSIQKLKVTLDRYQVSRPCSVNCSCDQPNNWRSQIISLNDLKEIEIKGFNGEEHGVGLLKVLLRCAGMLDRVTVNLSRNVPRSCIAYKEFPGILKAHPSVKFSIYRWCGDQVFFG